jgi:hypothetical protein
MADVLAVKVSGKPGRLANGAVAAADRRRAAVVAKVVAQADEPITLDGHSDALTRARDAAHGQGLIEPTSDRRWRVASPSKQPTPPRPQAQQPEAQQQQPTAARALRLAAEVHARGQLSTEQAAAAAGFTDTRGGFTRVIKVAKARGWVILKRIGSTTWAYFPGDVTPPAAA